MCGYHARTNVYPKFNKFQVKLFKMPHTLFVVKVFLSVIDKYQMITIQQNYSTENIFLSHLVIKNQKHICTYTVEIKKIYHVMIRVYQNIVDRYLVYDGPGINSPTICERNNIYQCSSFKCVVQVLNNSAITNYSLKYNSSLLKSDQT